MKRPLSGIKLLSEILISGLFMYLDPLTEEKGSDLKNGYS